MSGPGLNPRRDRREVLTLLGFLAAAPGLARAQDAAPTGQAPTPAPPRPASGPAIFPEAQFTPEGAPADLAATEDADRRMTAPVMIEGQGPFDFIVDTGANRSVISRELATQLALSAGRPAPVHGIVGAALTDTAMAERFRIGGREARRVTLPIIPAATLGGVGMLGVDGLKNQRVVLDFRASRLQIEPSSVPPHEGGAVAVVRARRRYGQLTVVDTELQGQRVAVILDTGAQVTIGNTALKTLVDRRADPTALRTQVDVLGATGQTAVGEYGAVPFFRLGPLQIRRLRVVYANLHPFALWGVDRQPALMLGMDVMRYFDRIALDFGRSEVRFTLPDQPFIDPAGDRFRRL